MHLIETQAAAMRFKISKPDIIPKFYPIPTDNQYIVIQADAKFQSRQYSYFNEVLQILKPYLDKENIKTIQLGGATDRVINTDFNLCGHTSYRQSAYIVKNSLLTIAVDSLLGHLASCFDTPSVVLFGNMYISQSKPYFHSPDKLICLQADLQGKNPSYSAVENPKVIDRIKPEEVANAVLQLLGLHVESNIRSIYFGSKYTQRLIETIPNHVVSNQFHPNDLLHIRYDYIDHTLPQYEQCIYQQLQQRKCVLVSDKRVNINALKQLRQNLEQFVYVVTDKHDVTFLKEIAESGIPYAIISYMPEEYIQNIKLDYSDYGVIQRQRVYTKADINDQGTKNLWAQGNKILLANGKPYYSKAHWLLDIPVDQNNPIQSFQIQEVDNETFWSELEWFYVYEKSLS